MLKIRRKHEVFGVGDFMPISAEHSAILAFLRRTEGAEILVVANTSDSAISTTLELTADFESIIGERIIDDGRIELGPYEFDWMLASADH